jgi:membrane associated rhomboid family serine protease
MFPLKDDNPTARFPALTLGLILLNTAIFLIRLALPGEADAALVRAMAFRPALLTEGSVAAALTLVTSQFLHGGLLHLGGNMLYLWIFGNNIEDHLGRTRFVPFYLGCGVLAGLTQWAVDPHSGLPLIGASGAIAGVLGAYAVLFPRARIHTLVLVFLFLRIVPVPAAIWLGIWFVFQAVGAGIAHVQGGAAVAWFAHLGGFVAGLLLVRVVAPRQPHAAPAFFAAGRWFRAPDDDRPPPSA